MKKGSITIFISMLLIFVLSLYFTLCEVVRYQCLQQVAYRNVTLAAESTFAEYCRPLWEEYKILAVDGGYGNSSLNLSRMDQTYGLYLEENGAAKGVHMFQLYQTQAKVDSYALLSDQCGAALIKEAALYEKEHAPEAVLSMWLSSCKKTKEENGLTLNLDHILEQGTSAVEEAHKQVDVKTADIKETDIKEIDIREPDNRETNIKKMTSEPLQEKKLITDNPIDLICQWKKQGILKFVLQEDADISTETIALEEVSSYRLLDTGTYDPNLSVSWEEKILFQLYILQMFSNYKKDCGHGGLKYQQEYILCGEKSDEQNLKGTVTRLLAVRETGNYISLLADTKKKAEALSMATAIAGASANPAIIKSVQLGILAAWAYAESILDVRTLLNGGKISYVKMSADWTADIYHLSECMNKTFQAKNCEKGMDYAGYLLFMRYYLVTKEQCAKRVMDLIEDGIRREENYSNIKIDQFIFAVVFYSEQMSRPLFLSFVPAILIDSNFEQFKMKKEMSYL